MLTDSVKNCSPRPQSSVVPVHVVEKSSVHSGLVQVPTEKRDGYTMMSLLHCHDAAWCWDPQVGLHSWRSILHTALTTDVYAPSTISWWMIIIEMLRYERYFFIVINPHEIQPVIQALG